MHGWLGYVRKCWLEAKCMRQLERKARYACDFSLDPNTADVNLILSDDNLTVAHVKEKQEYPDHEDRFTDYCQVLSSTVLRGRCYWEVDWSGREDSIAVSYKGIGRRGRKEECVFGLNDQSWCLRIFEGDYYVWHNRNVTALSHRVGVSSGKVGGSSGKVGVSSGRVGVFLDSEAGALSFYEISSDDKLFHLHSFSSSFSEPLFPGFELGEEGTWTSLDQDQDQGLNQEPEPGLMQDYLRSKADPSPSGVSLKSDRSYDFDMNFKSGQSRSSPRLRSNDNPRPEAGLEQDYLRSKPGPGPSGVSLRSDFSKELLLTLKMDKTLLQSSEDRSVLIGQEPQTELDSIFQNLETQVLEFVQQQLQRLRLLLSDHPQCSESEGAELSTEVLNISLDFLKKMDRSLWPSFCSTGQKVKLQFAEMN
ncbi:hypothetical protein WMY93_033279 [Mugilogobius chulae]|uniref:B30.2/SPRY domain-containing protein n=1 Tax=Mugilogobius chulae TaxID=88201 RepID=A0AAW0MP22_9GOBI